jgi:UPF0755 protein
MTIRGGRGPREEQAHPAKAGTWDEPRPEWETRRAANGQRNGRDGRGGGGGLSGFVKFLVFTVVLAAVVLGVLLTVLRPLVSSAVMDWAYDNPSALRMPFVADLVRENLGEALTEPASADATEVEFEIVSGDRIESLATRLARERLITNERAFIFQATLRDLNPKLKAGNYHVGRNLTPDQVVTALIENEIVVVVTPITFRESLRLEQMTAKIQLDRPANIDPREFYDLVKTPPPALLEDYPWLAEAGMPEGASLEGFLAAATYDLLPETTAEDLVRMMLDQFHDQVGEERMNVPESRGMSFYDILKLASIVEREAVIDDERPLIAGVYQNRLTRGGSWLLLHADPTVFYGVDTLRLEELGFDRWLEYTFWEVPDQPLGEIQLPEPLTGYNSYTTRGLPPGPICTPSLSSIDGALEPDTDDGYYFFLARPDGGGAHVFSKTQEEHDQWRREFGYL